MSTEKKIKKSPLPLFDSLIHFERTEPEHLNAEHLTDYKNAHAFLSCYKGSLGTFNAYRREIERLLHWSWRIAKKSLKQLKRDDIENFIRFCQHPPISWIGVKKVPRYLDKNKKRMPNPGWKPFLASISKAARRKGTEVNVEQFALSQGAIKELFAILSTFFNYLLQEEYVYMNPVALIRQKSKFIRGRQNQIQVRRLTSLQWMYVIETAEKMAEKNPAKHERTLFIMIALYSMYLRISELAANERWLPKMSDFYRDQDGNWWFKTIGKGNKERQIAVSDAMLNALKRYRLFLGYSTLPSPGDSSPLLLKIKTKAPITSTTYIREIVQLCFDEAIAQLSEDGHLEEAESLNEATVHWLRHTGISEDVKRRPREHVRDDAGHSSSATTDKYIDIELRERHRSAKKKPIIIN